MTTQNTTTHTETRNNAYETIPVFWWDWPDEAQLADFAKTDDRVKQADRPFEEDPEYAALYFVS
jgi:hypothetical protein